MGTAHTDPTAQQRPGWIKRHETTATVLGVVSGAVLLVAIPWLLTTQSGDERRDNARAAVLAAHPDATDIELARSGDRRYVTWADGDVRCSAPITDNGDTLLAHPVCQ
jgi:hypothetical protein